MTGKFITLEGGEGCGKSTQIKLLYEAFKLTNLYCIKTREPGGSPGAEEIRGLLVSGDAVRWDPVAETLLFYAARLDHVNKVIKPALAKGEYVLCDRFADSTQVYQGIGKRLTEDYIRSLHHMTLGNFQPDLTLVLDIDPAIGIKRTQSRHGTENRFESMDTDFHQAVRTGFLAIARREPERCAVIDAAASVDEVHRQITTIINQRLGLHLKIPNT